MERVRSGVKWLRRGESNITRFRPPRVMWVVEPAAKVARSVLGEVRMEAFDVTPRQAA